MTKHVRFPHKIARFSDLEGGQYGTVDLLAVTREQLELALGGDFVRFTRREAEELVEDVRRFLELESQEHVPQHRRHDHHHRHGEERLEVEERVVVEEEIKVTEKPARKRRATA